MCRYIVIWKPLFPSNILYPLRIKSLVTLLDATHIFAQAPFRNLLGTNVSPIVCQWQLLPNKDWLSLETQGHETKSIFINKYYYFWDNCKGHSFSLLNAIKTVIIQLTPSAVEWKNLIVMWYCCSICINIGIRNYP